MSTDQPRGSTETGVRVEVTVEAPIERAFAVFTEQVDSWWPSAYKLSVAQRADVLLEPRVGGRWYERAVDGKECDWGRVLSWDPPNQLGLSWQIAPDFTPEPDPERASRVDGGFA